MSAFTAAPVVKPFHVDRIGYDPDAALCYEAFDRPPLFDLRSDECDCSEHLLQSPWTCSDDAFRWVPDQADMPPLRFGGVA